MNDLADKDFILQYIKLERQLRGLKDNEAIIRNNNGNLIIVKIERQFMPGSSFSVNHPIVQLPSSSTYRPNENFEVPIRRPFTEEEENRRQRALRELEQLTISQWKYIKPFCQEYFRLSAISGNCFNEEILAKYFRKLPGALGLEITNRWYARPDVQSGNNILGIGKGITHTMEILQEKYRNIRIEKELKGICHMFL